MKLQESGEMYLETIYVLSKQMTSVRSIDVCEHMQFSKPSVSRAIGLLKKGGYVTVDNDGHLSLTESGFSVAEKIYTRHSILTSFFVSLGVEESRASEDACRIEHCISDESFEAIRKYTGNKKKGV